MTRSTAYTTLFTLALAGLFWIDPLFLPLILAGPVITGVVGDRRGVARPAAAAWFAAGLITLALDWAVNQEDQVFHLAMALWTAGLTLAVAAVHCRAHALRHRVSRVHRQEARP